jgi:hypothetical protein
MIKEQPTYQFDSRSHWLGNFPQHKIKLRVIDNGKQMYLECWENMRDLSTGDFKNIFPGIPVKELPTSHDKSRKFHIAATPVIALLEMEARNLITGDQIQEAYKAFGIAPEEAEKERREYIEKKSFELEEPTRRLLGLKDRDSGSPSRG